MRLEKDVSFTIVRGTGYARKMVMKHTDLIAELLAKGAWEVRHM